MTGKSGTMSNYPNGFQGGLMLDGLATHKAHSGKVFYVGSGSAGARTGVANSKSPSNSNPGTFLQPLKTLAYAVEQAVDARGDTIVCLPGMIDSLDAAVDIEAGNVTIIGLGVGNDRPQLTPAVVDCLDVEGDNVTIQNMYFNESAAERTAGAAAIDVVGSGFRFLGNHVDLGAHDDVLITVAASNNLVVAENKFVVTADGTESVVDLEGIVDNAQFLDNTLVTSVANLDEAFVDMEAIANTNTVFEGNKLLGGGVLKVGTADVGTVIVDGVQRPVEITAIDSEITAAGDESFKPSINGNCWVHGVWFVYSAADDTGNDITVSIETGVTILGQVETETATVAGDTLYAPNIGATGIVDEAAVAETVMLGAPLLVTGAAAAENLIDVVITTGTEGHATMYVAWAPADDVSTSEVQAS